MTRRVTLARQLWAAMAALSISAIVMSTVAFYLVYGLLARLKVVDLPPDDSDTIGWDIGITLAVSLMALMVALAIAIRLAQQIVRPLNAVGAAARRITGGDLGSRVELAGEAQGETALLIADFNAMADRLQGMADDVALWNAQIAHELRTPLTILRGRLQGAKDGVFPLDEQLVDGLLKQVESLARLVEDLRSVSLGESGRLELIREEVDLAAEIGEMAPMLRSMLEPAGFSLRLDLRPATARVDAARIRQAVLALVDNACRHADPCPLLIRVAPVGERVNISVIDSGPGLARGFEAHAFRQFVRSPRSGEASASGSGLGLAVVRGIARAHGGDVAYRAAQGQCAFDIDLPRRG